MYRDFQHCPYAGDTEHTAARESSTELNSHCRRPPRGAASLGCERSSGLAPTSRRRYLAAHYILEARPYILRIRSSAQIDVQERLYRLTGRDKCYVPPASERAKDADQSGSWSNFSRCDDRLTYAALSRSSVRHC